MGTAQKKTQHGNRLAICHRQSSVMCGTRPRTPSTVRRMAFELSPKSHGIRAKSHMAFKPSLHFIPIGGTWHFQVWRFAAWGTCKACPLALASSRHRCPGRKTQMARLTQMLGTQFSRPPVHELRNEHGAVARSSLRLGPALESSWAWFDMYGAFGHPPSFSRHPPHRCSSCVANAGLTSAWTRRVDKAQCRGEREVARC